MLWPFDDYAEHSWAYWAHFGLFAIAIIAFVIVGVMAFIYVERRGLGPFQLRWGPNRAGFWGFRFWGILQPIADAIKVLLKEDIVPAKADRWVHFLAPIIVFLPILLIFAVVPFHNGYGLIPDLNIGVLYVVAISGLGVIGIFMAGWASNNKYSIIAAMRVVAAMISYEIPLVLSILGVVLIAGSLSMNDIVVGHAIPFFLLTPLGFLIFLISSIAEINRGPFDVLEADSELVAGVHIEYSGIKFAMFYLGEYGHALAMSAIAAILFFKGWVGPGDEYVGILWFLVKMFSIFFFLVWVKATFPRLRIDQLVGFAWKFLLPLALINLMVIGVEVVAFEEMPWWIMFVNLAIAGVLILLWSKLYRLGGGRVEVEV